MAAVFLIAFAAAAASPCQTPRPISEEATRQAVLQAVFPALKVSSSGAASLPSRKTPVTADRSSRDAVEGESIYLVTGRPQNRAEFTASENLDTLKFSNTRRVRFKLFRWPGPDATGLLAVVQYDFEGANPALSCPSIGLLVQLAPNASGWKVQSRHLLETVHHWVIEKIDLLDLTGDELEELIVESQYGGAASLSAGLQVFDLSTGQFDESLNTLSWLRHDGDYEFTQDLDVERTRANRGKLFCVIDTTHLEAGKRFDPPRVSRPCFKRGHGVNPVGIRHRIQMRAALQ